MTNARSAARQLSPTFYDFCWDQKEKLRCASFRRINGRRIEDIQDFDYRSPSPTKNAWSQRFRVALLCDGSIPIPPPGWGAVQRDVWNLHSSLQKHGFDSLILNVKSEDELHQLCQDFKPHLINVHTDGADTLIKLLPYLKAFPTPVVSTTHHSGLSIGIPTYAALNARLADVIIAVSPSIRERFLRAGYRNVHFIPNGVNLSVFKPLPKKPNSVIGVGQNIPRKRWAELARFFLDKPNYHLTLCGPNMDSLASNVPVIPRAANITTIGNLSESETARLMGESEYLAHLCEIEACCLVIREGMASGCKVWTVPSNAQDLSNVAFSWKAAVEDADLGVRAAQEAVDRLGWERVTEKTAELFRLTLAAWKKNAH